MSTLCCPDNAKTYKSTDIGEYITGWLSAKQHSSSPSYTILEIKAMLHNATAMLEDSQDGIEAHFERKDYYSSEEFLSNPKWIQL